MLRRPQLAPIIFLGQPETGEGKKRHDKSVDAARRSACATKIGSSHFPRYQEFGV